MAGSNITLVVGTGYVGERVLARLPDGEATGLNRTERRAPHPVHRYDLDADGPLPLRLPARYRVLYTVAPAANSAADQRLERFLRQLRPAPACFVYISTTGVYGDRDGQLVGERDEPRPQTARARRRQAAEQALREWGEVTGTRICILRAPGIYGPDRLGVERIRAGIPVLREADATPGNRIHVADLVSCCLAALSDADAGGVFNVGDGDFRSSTAFAQEVALQLDLPPLPEVGRAQAEREFSRARLSFLAESRRIDTRRMREVLGVTPRYAQAADGIRASLREEGLL